MLCLTSVTKGQLVRRKVMAQILLACYAMAVQTPINFPAPLVIAVRVKVMRVQYSHRIATPVGSVTLTGMMT